MWSFERYQKWMAKRTQWHIPNHEDEAPDREEVTTIVLPSSVPATAKLDTHSTRPSSRSAPDGKNPGGTIEIEPVEGGISEVIKRLS